MSHGYVFESTTVGMRQDHETAEAAIAIVEAYGGGNVVKFVKRPNLPNCLPEFVLNCLEMWSFQDGEWWSHYIYDGHGGKLNRERPN